MTEFSFGNDPLGKQALCNSNEQVDGGTAVSVNGTRLYCSKNDTDLIKKQLDFLAVNNATMSVILSNPQYNPKAPKNFELFSSANAAVRALLPGGRGLSGLSAPSDQRLADKLVSVKETEQRLYQDLKSATKCTGESDGVKSGKGNIPKGLNEQDKLDLANKYDKAETALGHAISRACPTADSIKLKGLAFKEFNAMLYRKMNY